jgi:hypothetical protein
MPVTWEEIKRHEEELRKQRELEQQSTPPPPVATPTSPATGLSWADIQEYEKELPSTVPPTVPEKIKSAAFGAAAAAKSGAVRLAGQTATMLDQVAVGAKEAGTRALFDFVARGNPEFQEQLKDPKAYKQIKERLHQEAWKASPIVGAVAAIGAAEPEEVRAEREKINKVIGQFVAENGQYSERTQKAAEEGKFWDPAYLAEKGVIDVGGQLATAIGLSAMTGGASAGLGFLGLLEAGGARKDAIERMKAKSEAEGIDLDTYTAEAKATGEGLITGGVATVMEMLPFRFFGEATQGVKNQVAKTVTQKLVGRMARGAGGIIGEGFEELATEIAGDVAQYYIEDDPASFDNAKRRYIETAVLGGFGGGLGGVASFGAGAVRSLPESRKAKLISVADQIHNLAKTPDGRAGLEQLSENPAPSRSDLKKAGITVKMRLNTEERLAIAQAADLDLIDSAEHQLRKLGQRPDPALNLNEADTIVETAKIADQAPVEPTPQAKQDLTDKQDRYAKAATDAIGRGDTDAAESYQRLADEAGRDLQKLSAVETMAEDPAPETPETPSAPVPEQGPNIPPPREQKKVVRPPIVTEEEGTARIPLGRDPDDAGEMPRMPRDLMEIMQSIGEEAIAQDRKNAPPVEEDPDLPAKRAARKKKEATPEAQAARKAARAAQDRRVEEQLDEMEAIEEAGSYYDSSMPQMPADLMQTLQDIGNQVPPARTKKKVVRPPIIADEAGSLTVPMQQLNKMFNGLVDAVLAPGSVLRKKTFGAAKTAKGLFVSDVHPDVRTARTLADHRLARKSQEVYQAITDYQAGVRKASGVSENAPLPDHLANLADQYLKGRVELRHLPEPMQVPLKVLREAVDSMSREAVNSGAITGGGFLGSVYARTAFFDDLRNQYAGLRQQEDRDLARPEITSWIMAEGKAAGTPISAAVAGVVTSTILNDGMYLTRTFDAFEDADWALSMPDSVRHNMFDYLRSEDNKRVARIDAINARRTQQGKPPLDNTKRTDKNIRRQMQQILDDALLKGEMKAFMADNGLRQNRNILKRRKDLPQAWKDYLGEVRDPVANAIKTQLKIANLIDKFRMQTEIRDAGLKNGFLFEEHDDNRPETATQQIAPSNSLALNPMAGMWASPEVVKMIEGDPGLDQQAQHWLYKSMMTLDTKSQRAKTAWSIQSHMRQVFGNPIMLMANGHMNFLKKRPSVWKAAMQGKGTKEQREYINRAAELGLIGEGVEYGLFNRMMLDTSIDKIMREVGGKTGGKLPKGLAKAAHFIRKQYGFEDTMFKLYAWEAEKAKYAETGKFDTSTPEGVAALEEYTANVVRRTNPTYSELPRIIETIRNIPGGGMFMAFPFSQLVNAGNRFQQGWAEVRDSNPAVKALGVKRLMSQAAVYAAPFALEQVSAAMLGIDDEERKAFRETLPPWARYAPLFFVRNSGKGKYTYINMGFVDPHTYFTQPIRALLEGASDGEVMQSLAAAATSVVEPYIQETMTATATVDLLRNTTSYGSKIWEEDDSLGTKMWLGAAHAFKNTIKTGTQISLENINKGFNDEISKGGKEYSARDETAGMLSGLKVENYDAKQSFSFAARRAIQSIESARKVMNRDIGREGTVAGRTVRNTMERVDAIREKAITDMHKAYNNYSKIDPDINLGYLTNELTRGRLSEDDIAQVFTGVPKPYVPTQLRVLDRMIEQSDGERQAGLVAAREAKLDSTAFSVGSTRTDHNGSKMDEDIRVLQERGVGGPEVITRMVDEVKKKAVESKVAKVKKESKGQYSDEEIRAGVMQAFAREGWKWTKTRVLRAQRIGQRFGMQPEEIKSVLEGVREW